MSILRAVPLVFASVLACAEARPVEDADTNAAELPKPIFRSVQFGQGEVTLGEPLRDKKRLGEVTSDTILRLADSVFGGAQAIWIHLGPGDTVRGMTYEYGVDTAFDARIASYIPLLGPPTRRTSRGTPDVDLTDVIEWQDSATHFELRWITRPGGAIAQSELRDRPVSCP